MAEGSDQTADTLLGFDSPADRDWSSSVECALNANRFTTTYLGEHILSDIAFHVEQEDLSIPAHSLIVAAASPMLERCCFGSGNLVQPVTVIRVPPLGCADSFRVVLRHLYGLASPSAVVTNIGLTIDNAAEVLCLADYFDLRLLRDYSEQVLLPAINVNNVCAIYSRVRLLDNQLVTRLCWQKMVFNVVEVLGSALDVFDDDEARIAELLLADDLRVRDESELFTAMYDWAEGKMVSSATRPRQILQDLLRYVRFGCMTYQQFCQCIFRAENGFFSDTEIGFTLHGLVKGNWCGRANPFGVVDVGIMEKAEESRGKRSRTESLPLPHWRLPRAPLIISAESMSVGGAVRRKKNVSFNEEYCQIIPVDLAYEYILTGLTIPNFKGEIYVVHSSGELLWVKAYVENDMVIFEEELGLNNNNIWNLCIDWDNKNQAFHKIITTKKNSKLHFWRGYKSKYTVVKTIHFGMWKRSSVRSSRTD